MFKIDVNHIIKITKNKYFMMLYKDIKNNFEKVLSENINIQILNKKCESFFEDNEFTSNNIKNKIEGLGYGYELNYINNTIIYFCEKKINKIIPKVIIHMFQIMVLLKKLFNKKNHKQKLIYFETKEKKKFPKKNIILGPNEVNSGLTILELYENDKNGDIILYRKEEALKVLIHELIHSNLIDSKIIFSNKTNEFSNMFCVNYKILLNEAFTESIATIINLFYIHFINKLKKKDLDIMFYNEMKYSYYICNKIIKFYNINDISDVLKKNNTCINNFPQKTNVFSYYILKNIILSRHIEFTEKLNKYSKDYKINSDIFIVEMIKIIINNMNIQKIKINDKNKSLRLCLYELKF